MKIIVPTGWHEVTLNQYIEITKVPSLGFDETESALRVLSILTGVDDSYFIDMDYRQLKLALAKIAFVYKKPQGRIRQKVRINGRRYRVNYLPSTLTAGEYIDLTHWTKTPQEAIENLNKIISVYLKPVNVFGFKLKNCYEKKEGKYVQTMSSREWTAEHVGGCLTMDIVFPMSDFFLTLYEALLKNTQDFLKKANRKQMQEIQKRVSDLQRSGDGI